MGRAIVKELRATCPREEDRMGWRRAWLKALPLMVSLQICAHRLPARFLASSRGDGLQRFRCFIAWGRTPRQNRGGGQPSRTRAAFHAQATL